MTIDHPSFGRLDPNRVIIFDTTLRDGEQSPGFSMNLAEKVRLAHALAELGADVIEAGFPVASPGDFDSVRAIAAAVRGPVICGLARSAPGDITRAAEAVRGADRPRIHTFISTSPLHMKYKLRMTPDDVLEAVTASVTLARRFVPDVEWSAEDGSRTDPDFLARCVEAAIAAGATTINIPDTVGYALPEDITRIFTDLRTRVPGADTVIFSAHNHNDLGLAVANTIAALRAGARQVECTINGIGERAGNAALEEIVDGPAHPARCRADAARPSSPNSSCAPRACCRPSPASTCSPTRPSSAATPSPMKVRHPSGRHAEERPDLRNHDARKRWLDQNQAWSWASIPAAQPSATSSPPSATPRSATMR